MGRANYQATPIQPIAHALIEISEGGAPVLVAGSYGFSAIARTVGGAGAGDFTLTLDPGVPGAVSLPSDIGSAEDAGRALVQVRGSATATIPGGTSIVTKNVSYVAPANPNAGVTQVRLVLANATIQVIGPLYQPVEVL
jgi:hypothetical protein